MTRDYLKENAAGALQLAETLVDAGHKAQEQGHDDFARRFYSANAKARALWSELDTLAKYQEPTRG